MRRVELVNLKDVIAKDILQQSDTAAKAFAFTLFSEIISWTPVDTGRARANWNISNDSPDYSTTDNTASRGFDFSVSGGKDIYIANGLPYIVALDSGHSSQAPNGIISPALSSTRSKFL